MLLKIANEVDDYRRNVDHTGEYATVGDRMKAGATIAAITPTAIGAGMTAVGVAANPAKRLSALSKGIKGTALIGGGSAAIGAASGAVVSPHYSLRERKSQNENGNQSNYDRTNSVTSTVSKGLGALGAAGGFVGGGLTGKLSGGSSAIGALAGAAAGGAAGYISPKIGEGLAQHNKKKRVNKMNERSDERMQRFENQ